MITKRGKTKTAICFHLLYKNIFNKKNPIYINQDEYHFLQPLNLMVL